MLKFFALFAMIFTCSNALADWVPIGTNKTNRPTFTVYYDPATLKRNGKFVDGWTMYDYEKIQKINKFSFFSIRMKIYFDCQNDEMTETMDIYTTGHMGDGDIFNPKIASNPIAFPPGSINAGLEEIFCKKQ